MSFTCPECGGGFPEPDTEIRTVRSREVRVRLCVWCGHRLKRVEYVDDEESDACPDCDETGRERRARADDEPGADVHCSGCGFLLERRGVEEVIEA